MTMKMTFGAAVAAAALFAAPAFAQSPNDAQIASIVVTANQVDIDAGKLAESKGSNPEVKASRNCRWSHPALEAEGTARSNPGLRPGVPASGACRTGRWAGRTGEGWRRCPPE